MSNEKLNLEKRIEANSMEEKSQSETFDSGLDCTEQSVSFVRQTAFNGDLEQTNDDVQLECDVTKDEVTSGQEIDEKNLKITPVIDLTNGLTIELNGKDFTDVLNDATADCVSTSVEKIEISLSPAKSPPLKDVISNISSNGSHQRSYLSSDASIDIDQSSLFCSLQNGEIKANAMVEAQTKVAYDCNISQSTQMNKEEKLNKSFSEPSKENCIKSDITEPLILKKEKNCVSNASNEISYPNQDVLLNQNENNTLQSTDLSQIRNTSPDLRKVTFKQSSELQNQNNEKEMRLKFCKLSPIYRLSLRQSHYLPFNAELPTAKEVIEKWGEERAGVLRKLSSKGFPYIAQWRRRFCILSQGRLYIYASEKESNLRSDEGRRQEGGRVLELKYFDRVAPVVPKEARKAANAFVVCASDRSLFDPGRHLFAADNPAEMNDWVSKLRSSISQIRVTRRPISALPQKLASVDQPSAQQRSPLGSDLERRINTQIEQHSNRFLAKDETDTASSFPDDSKSDAVPEKPKRDEKKRNDFAFLLEQKLQKETAKVPILKEIKQKNESTDSPLDEEKEHDDFPSNRRRTSGHKKAAKMPVMTVETNPTLESVTKYRPKGPTGRRAPLRRPPGMTSGASSAASLLSDGSGSRDVRPVLPPRIVDESVLPRPLNASHPTLAYHYSSDEDSSENTGSNRSIGLSASNQNLETLEEENSSPQKYQPEGLFISEKKIMRNSEFLLEQEIDYRSLPRYLSRSAKAKRDLIDRRADNEQFTEIEVVTTSLKPLACSTGKLSCSGRASPEMDALDNLLMNRSLKSSTAAAAAAAGDPRSLLEAEGSEASTCKATQDACEEKPQYVTEIALRRTLATFSTNLQHLQDHVGELQRRTIDISGDQKTTNGGLKDLRQTTDGIQNDIQKLTNAVSKVGREVSLAKEEFVSKRQEAENLKRDACEALSKAQRSQAEFREAKHNYECTMVELHSMISSIQSSFVVPDTSDVATHRAPPLGDLKTRSLDENGKKEECKESQKRSQRGGYHSFFQRPSSLIYGLTAKNGKVNKKKEKEERKEREDKYEYNKLKTDSWGKNSSKNSSILSLEKSDVENGNSNLETENLGQKYRTKKVIQSNEKIPLIDDSSEMLPEKNSAFGVSRVSINVNAPPRQYNFHLEKSLSSPTMPITPEKRIRPNKLPLRSASQDNCKEYSAPSSPESPVSPTSPFAFPLSSNGMYQRPSTELPLSYPSSPRHSAIFRQQSMPSVPEEGPGHPSPRPSSPSNASSSRRVFAISKQKSSPNIPSQRLSAAPSFPLQRQRSLGIVPEEGHGPRASSSVLSILDDRPIVDRTLPLSPSASITSFALTPSSSVDRLLDGPRIRGSRASLHHSMEVVTGPVVSGSSLQGSVVASLPESGEFEIGDRPIATSSIKRKNHSRKTVQDGLFV